MTPEEVIKLYDEYLLNNYPRLYNVLQVRTKGLVIKLGEKVILPRSGHSCGSEGRVVYYYGLLNRKFKDQDYIRHCFGNKKPLREAEGFTAECLGFDEALYEDMVKYSKQESELEDVIPYDSIQGKLWRETMRPNNDTE